jgi:signal transduction histidine kinase
MKTINELESFLQNIANISYAVFFICDSNGIERYVTYPKIPLEKDCNLNELLCKNDFDLLMKNVQNYLHGKAYEQTFAIDYHVPSKEISTCYDLNFIHKTDEYAILGANVKLDPSDIGQMLFITIVNHELRTPLTSIMGTLALLGEQDMTPQQKMLVKVAKRNSDQLLMVINDILSLQTIAQGRMTFHIVKTNLITLVKNGIAANQGYADKYGVNFILKKHPKELKASCDPLRTVQILNNYLANAAKYSPRGSDVEILVEEVLVDNKRFGKVSVVDHGEGIREEEQDHVFDRYFQSESTISEQKGGTGLGLYISKYIAEAQEGSVGFISKHGEGSTFYFMVVM